MGTDANKVLWRPGPEMVCGSRMGRFLSYVRSTRGVELEDGDYRSLHEWSIFHLDEFWTAVAEFFEVGLDPVRSRAVQWNSVMDARWFAETKVSYVREVFRNRDPASIALIALDEDGERLDLTWAELRESTARMTGFLRSRGVGAGDTVVAYLPNTWQTVVAFLAAASLGAIWSSCSPDFGSQAVVDRFAQIEPKILFATDGYRYGGKDFDRRKELQAIQAQLPTLVDTVFVSSKGLGRAFPGLSWEDAIASQPPELELDMLQVSFEHPLWILYSSGTTGLPKAITHSHGGILLEHLKWLGLQSDLGSGDRVFWMTTTGWVMWNFLVSSLLVGATPILYDGSAGYPTVRRPWELAGMSGATCFGAGASYYSACMRSGTELPTDLLRQLRMVGSTGSPLQPEAYDYLYGQLGPDLWLFSTSGGTDIATAFVGGSPLVPVRRGELQAPALGVDVQAWDEQGHRVQAGVGELVVVRPMPSMPIRLWNDPGNQRLRDAYFSKYPGVWRHGDWIEFLDSGGAIIHGRSDSTINRGGIRIGTAEIYRAVTRVPEVADAVVVDVPREGRDSWMVLFVSLRDGMAMSEDVRTRIAREIRTSCSPRHLPNDVLQAPDIPRTLSGKVLEVPLKRLLMGEDLEMVASPDSLANPSALQWFADFAKSPHNIATGE